MGICSWHNRQRAPSQPHWVPPCHQLGKTLSTRGPGGECSTQPRGGVLGQRGLGGMAASQHISPNSHAVGWQSRRCSRAGAGAAPRASSSVVVSGAQGPILPGAARPPWALSAATAELWCHGARARRGLAPRVVPSCHCPRSMSHSEPVNLKKGLRAISDRAVSGGEPLARDLLQRR